MGRKSPKQIPRIFFHLKFLPTKNSINNRSSHQICSVWKGACNSIKKETLAQVFSCEFCQISKNTFFIERLCWMLLLKSLWIYQKVSDILKSGCGSSRPCRFYQKVISKSFVKLTGKCLPWNPNFSKLEVLVNQNNVWNLFNVNNKDNDIFIFILNFEPISHIVLEFLLLTLNK